MQKLIRITIAFIVIFNASFVLADQFISPDVAAKAKKAIVPIHTRIALSAHGQTESWSGTGFIADKTNGLIVTNAHVVGSASIGTYFITFDTGQQTEAKLAYYDLWQDQAILKVDPASVPSSIEEITFSKTEPKMNQPVFIIGNNEGQAFSLHSGSIASLYDINGAMPQQSYVVNLNIAGGSSGSPLMNEKGEAVGLHYGGAQTFGLSVKGAYISKSLDAVRAGKAPVRKHTGVICKLYSLDKAVKHRSFPKNAMEKYLKAFPDARNMTLSVDYTIAGSPSEGLLRAGDIIWEVNGKALGASLYDLDSAMDESSANSVKLTIYRDGISQVIDVPLYNVEANKVTKILQFAGANFFESDDFISAKSGIPLKSLSVVNVQTGSSFSVIPMSFAQNDRAFYRLLFTNIGGHKLSNLDDLTKAVPDLIQRKFIKAEFKNFQPNFQQFSGILISGHADLTSDITLDSIDTKPRSFTFDDAKMEWVAREVVGGE